METRDPPPTDRLVSDFAEVFRDAQGGAAVTGASPWGDPALCAAADGVTRAQHAALDEACDRLLALCAMPPGLAAASGAEIAHRSASLTAVGHLLHRASTSAAAPLRHRGGFMLSMIVDLLAVTVVMTAKDGKLAQVAGGVEKLLRDRIIALIAGAPQ